MCYTLLEQLDLFPAVVFSTPRGFEFEIVGIFSASLTLLGKEDYLKI